MWRRTEAIVTENSVADTHLTVMQYAVDYVHFTTGIAQPLYMWIQPLRIRHVIRNLLQF